LDGSIFYLDDDSSQLELFEEMFGAEFDVRTSASPAEARRLLAERAADVVIGDQSMPEMDGTDFLREVALTRPGACASC
jgi:DNA-binding NtrC family response regulator